MVSVEQLHSSIFQDPEWRAWAKIVSSLTPEDDVKFGCDHGIQHWLNVSRIAADFARQAGGTDYEVALADIAGLLHDCGMICGEKNHAENGASIVRPYLRARLGDAGYGMLTDSDIEVVCHAIAQHSDYTEIVNLVDAALVFADKVDLGRHRTLSINNDIQLSASQIERINYAVTDDAVIVSYTVTPDFNAYFFLSSWPKAYEVPLKIAVWLKKDCQFFVNNQRIILPK